ncbi:hypothetical protein F5X98DRAFT_369673 [Xylaria grammica]|nr:hypothetical protein F5X98DRAFT_369673 [Xylaria grammica]
MPKAEYEYLTLPTVAAVRPERTPRRAPTNYRYSLAELIQYYTGNDDDLVWGPFYKRFRARRRERTEFKPFTLSHIWERIPEATQTRPGMIGRSINKLFGRDPPPTLSKTIQVKEEEDDDRREKSKTAPKFVPDWKEEIKLKRDFSPSQIDFTKWYGRLKHPVDYDDEFYKTNYEALYNRVCEFADDWFGKDVWIGDYRDDKDDKTSSIWYVPMTEQFIQYARVVAHEDAGYVNWNEILNDPKHRKWLVVGIFAQIIERKIFNQLLFGAPQHYQDELERHDSHWVLQEGFTRKEGRRQIVRAALGMGLVPEHFWDAVDDLAGQTVLIFQPLLTLVALGKDRWNSEKTATFWQETHSLLAMAGYFHVCMAASPSIFHILSASPGARFQWDEEAHADQSIYADSKAFHRSHEERWRMIAEITSKEGESGSRKLLEALDADKEINQYGDFPVTEDEYRTMDHERRRGGKVMYAVFPKLTRYSAENIGEHILSVKPTDFEETPDTGEGMRISILSRCMVVYYQGLVHLPADEDDGITLDQHLECSERDRLNILPYWRYYWRPDGYVARSIHWPLWPDHFDKYWLWWGLAYVLGQFLQFVIGPLPQSRRYQVWALLVYQPLAWFLWEIVLYVAIRSITPWFQGPLSYFKLHAIGVTFYLLTEFLLQSASERTRAFALLCQPLHTIDVVLLKMLPSWVLNVAGALDQEWHGPS